MKYRIYTDASGEERKIKYVRDGHFVQWHKYYPPSVTEIWELEDGSKVSIPINSWNILGIRYSDSVSMED